MQPKKFKDLLEDLSKVESDIEGELIEEVSLSKKKTKSEFSLEQYFNDDQIEALAISISQKIMGLFNPLS